MKNISAQDLLRMIERYENKAHFIKEPLVSKKQLKTYLKMHFGVGYIDFSNLAYYKDELLKKINSSSIQRDYPVIKDHVVTMDDLVVAYRKWLSNLELNDFFEKAWNEFSPKSTPTFFTLICLENQAMKVRDEIRNRDEISLEEQEFLAKYDLCFPRNLERNVIRIVKQFFDTFNQYYSFLGFDPEKISSLEKIKIGRDWSYQNEEEKAKNFVIQYTKEDVLKAFESWNFAMQVNEEFIQAWKHVMSNMVYAPIEYGSCPSYAQLNQLQEKARLCLQKKKERMHLEGEEKQFLNDFCICFSHDFSKNNIVYASHFFDVFNLYSISNGLNLHQMDSIEKICMACKWAQETVELGPKRERKNEICI